MVTSQCRRELQKEPVTCSGVKQSDGKRGSKRYSEARVDLFMTTCSHGNQPGSHNSYINTFGV
jgi:hypothetical protein